MSWQVTPVAAIYAAVVIVSIVTAFLASQHRTSRAASFLTIAMIGGSLWTLGYMLGVFNADLAWKKDMIRVEFLGIMSASYFFFLFAMSYTSFERWLNRTTIFLLAVVPVLSLVLALTHDRHNLWYQSFTLTTVNGLVVSVKTYGIGFWIATAYGYLEVFGGSLLMLADMVRHPQMFRGQSWFVATGACLPLVANAAYLLGFNPLRPYDGTSIAFVISSVLFLIAIVRLRLFDLVPIAHDLVFRSISSGVVLVNAEGRILEMNPAAEQILGRQQGAVAGKLALEVFPEHKDLITQFRDVTETRTQIVMGPSRRSYDMQLAPLYHRSRTNELIGRVILLTDITEREHLIEELDAYAHTVAHDLKNPINIMMGYAELLQERLGDALDKDTARVTESIIVSGRKMDSIISSLLLLAKLRRLDDIQPTTIDMGAVVTDSLSRFGPRIAETKAKVTRPDTWPDGVVSFAPWIEEIWANYIGNALKYGGTPPNLELGSSMLPDGRAQFWVKDNGQGLSREEQESLFSEFSRLAHHSAKEGHGLGLSIVRRIATQLGGEVGVESTPGKGSKFYFVLPIKPGAEAGEKPLESKSAA